MARKEKNVLREAQSVLKILSFYFAFLCLSFLLLCFNNLVFIFYLGWPVLIAKALGIFHKTNGVTSLVLSILDTKLFSQNKHFTVVKVVP